MQRCGFVVVPAPAAHGTFEQRRAPALREAERVFLVAQFSAGRGADVVPHDAAQGDRIDPARGAGAQAEVDVFAAIDVALIETAEPLPEAALDQHARSR